LEKSVVKNISKTLPQYISVSGRMPLRDLDGIITLNGRFYERHHDGVPTIDPDQHRLMLHGLVDRPMIFTMGGLGLYPQHEWAVARGRDPRRQDAQRDQDAEPLHVHRRFPTGRQASGVRGGAADISNGAYPESDMDLTAMVRLG
jgi:hypothetical protein